MKMIAHGAVRARTVLPVAFAALSLLACGDDVGDPGPPPPDPPPSPVQFTRAFGNVQTGTVGQRLARPIGVAVLDEDGKPIEGVPVVFEVQRGNGSPSPASTTTDENGVASAAWVLGTISGAEHLMKASIPGSDLPSIYFSASANPDVAVLLTLLAGDGQEGLRGQPLASLIEVLVTDQYGNGVPDQIVKFSTNTNNGTMTPGDMRAGADGKALARWTLGDLAGRQEASVWSPGLTGSPARISAMAR